MRQNNMLRVPSASRTLGKKKVSLVTALNSESFWLTVTAIVALVGLLTIARQLTVETVWRITEFTEPPGFVVASIQEGQISLKDTQIDWVIRDWDGIPFFAENKISAGQTVTRISWYKTIKKYYDGRIEETIEKVGVYTDLSYEKFFANHD